MKNETFILRDQSILSNLLDYINNIELVDKKPIKVVISKYCKSRNESQNGLYWSWLRVIALETGDNENSLHSYFTDKYLSKVENIVFGKKVLQCQSTTELNIKEFSHYLTRIEAFSNTYLGISLPNLGDL